MSNQEASDDEMSRHGWDMAIDRACEEIEMRNGPREVYQWISALRLKGTPDSVSDDQASLDRLGIKPDAVAALERVERMHSSDARACAHCGATDQPLGWFGGVEKCKDIKACCDRDLAPKPACTCWSGYLSTPLMVPRRPDCPVHGTAPLPNEVPSRAVDGLQVRALQDFCNNELGFCPDYNEADRIIGFVQATRRAPHEATSPTFPMYTLERPATGRLRIIVSPAPMAKDEQIEVDEAWLRRALTAGKGTDYVQTGSARGGGKTSAMLVAAYERARNGQSSVLCGHGYSITMHRGECPGPNVEAILRELMNFDNAVVQAEDAKALYEDARELVVKLRTMIMSTGTDSAKAPSGG